MNVENFLLVISTIIAVCSLVLSIYTFHITRKDKLPKLKLELSRSGYRPDKSSKRLPGIHFDIANIGDNPIFIRTIFISWESPDENLARSTFMIITELIIDSDKPRRIESGEAIDKTLPLEEIIPWPPSDPNIRTLEVTFSVRDGTGNFYTSNEIFLRMKDW